MEAAVFSLSPCTAACLISHFVCSWWESEPEESPGECSGDTAAFQIWEWVELRGIFLLQSLLISIQKRQRDFPPVLGTIGDHFCLGFANVYLWWVLSRIPSRKAGQRQVWCQKVSSHCIVLSHSWAQHLHFCRLSEKYCLQSVPLLNSHLHLLSPTKSAQGPRKSA